MDSVYRASLIWNCTARTIVNRLSRFEKKHPEVLPKLENFF